MSAVVVGAEVGIHPRSHWNNPEPEIVLAINSRVQVVGATLGKAKDNNASCAIGPFIRLFDEHFGMDDVRRCFSWAPCSRPRKTATAWAWASRMRWVTW